MDFVRAWLAGRGTVEPDGATASGIGVSLLVCF